MPTSLENKKKEIEVKSSIREFVFGVQDALISTVGLLAGVWAATQNQRSVIITGCAAAFTGALSMATGSYLSSKAQKEIFEREFKEQERLIEGEPYVAQESLLDAISEEGVSRQNAYRIVQLFAREHSFFIKTFQEKVLGIGTADISNPVKGALVMYFSFVSGAFVPVAPYIFLQGNWAIMVSVTASAAALFGVGLFKNFLAKKNLWLGGLEFLTVAVGSAGLGWLIGSFFD